MATAARPGPFARKSHDVLVRDATADPEHGLKRAVGVLDLTGITIPESIAGPPGDGGDDVPQPAPQAGPA